MKHWRFLLLTPLVAATHQLGQAAAFRAVDNHGGPVEILPFFGLVEVWNPGISFGMFKGLAYSQWVLSFIAIGITMFLLRWLSRTEHGLTATALGLVIGGAVGNTIDRLRFGAVADYLDFHVYGRHWPAFNATDVAIVIGIGLLMLREFGMSNKFGERRNKPM